MKLWQKFLVFLLPIPVIVGVKLFFPTLMPDTTGLSDIRDLRFNSPIEYCSNGDVEADLHTRMVGRFVLADIGKLRLAFPKENNYVPENRGSTIKLVRTTKVAAKPTPTIGIMGRGATIGPIHFTELELEDITGGHLIKYAGRELKIINGILTFDERDLSTLDKPLLVVIDDSDVITLTEELDLKLIRADVKPKKKAKAKSGTPAKP